MLHFIWLSKPGVQTPYAYALVLVVLLGYRVAVRWRPEGAGKNAIGEEVAERPAGKS
jgi:DMSO/TMAO reductase YedYZ heme-binding membrane subunit